MDETRLVLVLSNTEQWEDKTDEVFSCIAEPGTGQVRISYKANPEREYRYRQEGVWGATEQKTGLRAWL